MIVLAFAASVTGSAPAQATAEEPRPGCGPGWPIHRCYTPGDYDGDRKADLAMFRPAEGVWYVKRSSDNEPSAVHWGLSDDKLVPADYDGDRIDDFAVFRPSVATPTEPIPPDAIWYVYYSTSRKWRYEQFGSSDSRPAPGDYDGDGKADFAVVLHGTYKILRSLDNTIVYITLPTSDPNEFEDSNHNDINVPGDYDGDGVTDAAIFDEQNTQPTDEPAHPGGPRVWVIQRSSAGPVSIPLGGGEDVPVPGDYNGDGKTDVAVWHPRESTWSIIENLDGGFAGYSVREVLWGKSDDVVAPADYDGDGKTDLAVWRPDEKIWEILLSEFNQCVNDDWGLSGDIPVPMSLKRDAD